VPLPNFPVTSFLFRPSIAVSTLYSNALIVQVTKFHTHKQQAVMP
jgi:hypothetical protein